MKYKYKLEIKEKNEWVDFTKYCIQPFSLKDKIDETLATMTVKMYIDRAETITPSAKARFYIYENQDGDYVLKDSYDFIVDSDNAYKEVLNGIGYWAHEVIFTEPIALLQKYTVDNIALTYQLEDVVQYLDTGALKGNIRLAATGKGKIKTVDIPIEATDVTNIYYNYYFDAGPYVSKDSDGNTTTHIGLNEWSKIIYFKNATINGRTVKMLHRIDKNGNEVRCSDPNKPQMPFVPYCPLWCEEINGTDGEILHKYQLAYDVYVETINLETGEIDEPEHYIRWSNLCRSDLNQFSVKKSDNSVSIPSVGPGALNALDPDGGPAPGEIKTSFAPSSYAIWDVDSYNSDRKSYCEINGGFYPFWINVKANRRYNVRYIRNKNVKFSDGVSFANAYAVHLPKGLPSNCVYYKYRVDSHTSPVWRCQMIGEGNPLQYPELRFSFDVLDISEDAGTIDVTKPTPSTYAYKYNCYEYLRKAFYATGSYKEDAALPFAMSDEVRERLEKTVIYESQNVGNTLYDICLYIGRYLHAIPYCYFDYSPDDIEKENELLFLDFLQLGQSEYKQSEGQVMSLYNSRNFAEYLSSFDSYVNNLVNNDSDIEEVICAKSDDGSSLVCADNAVLLLSRPCYGIKEFYVSKRSSHIEWKSLIKNNDFGGASFICEKNIYNVLDFRAEYTPNKGSCLYYSLGSNKIEGLQYKRPNPISSGEENTAIQNIIGRIWWYDTVASSVNVNDYIFKIKYRTYDDTRIRIYRPDLKKYMLNTVNDHYPMQRTFRSQTEKVINADFYGKNLSGELIRTGNEIKQCDILQRNYDALPRVGDLHNIDNAPHYVSEVTIPFYNEYISASIIYSKDYQRLSSIVSIPAENRFYEIATQGIIKRTVANDEFVLIDTVPHTQNTELTSEGRVNLLNRILSNNSTPIRYATVTFKNKEDNAEPWNISIIKPVHTFSMYSGFGMTIDMEDNYSAGTQVLNSAGFNFSNASNIAGAFNAIGKDIASLYAAVLAKIDINESSKAYRVVAPIRYCDKFGNADLYDIKLYGNIGLTKAQISAQPLLVGELLDESGNLARELYKSDDNELRKDNRESISFQPQFNAIAMRDSIIIGSGFWKEKSKSVGCYAYNKLLNKNDEYLPQDGVSLTFSYSGNGKIIINNLPENAVSIAFAYETVDNEQELIFGINERTTQIVLSFVKSV